MEIPWETYLLNKLKVEKIMNKICGIYIITNKINNKKYIGLSKNCYRRWNEHKEVAKRPRKSYQLRVPLYRAMRKYGIENFTFEVIEKCSPNELKEREIYWIKELQTYEKGYNATRGGDLPQGHILKGEKHGMSKLTVSDVRLCRKLYARGFHSHDIWKKYFKNIIAYSGFQSMWHGRTWKHINPKAFKNNPHPKVKVTQKDILDIRKKSLTLSPWTIYKDFYKGKLGYATIWDIVNYKNRFSK